MTSAVRRSTTLRGAAGDLQPTLPDGLKIKFREGNHAGFYREVKRRVNAYFDATGSTRYADRRLWLKAALYTAQVAISYTLILSNAFGPWGTLLLANVFGIGTLMLGINVAHDAAHDALTRWSWVNRTVQTIIFTLLGANAYLWRLRHVKSHHTFPNVNGCDIDIDQNSFLRLSPNHRQRWFHRFQHLYAPFIFWLVDVHTVLYQDFVYLFKRRLANMVDIRHPAHEYAMFAACKVAYLAVVVGVPMIMLDLPWWQVLLGAAMMSFLASVLFVTLLIGTHFAEEAKFPHFDRDGYIAHDWAEHALVTSVDWSPTSRLALFVAGGANCHAAHHLFPTICHVHYIAITRIIKQTAGEFGLRYNCTTLPRLVRSHFRFLRRMGRDEIAKGSSPSLVTLIPPSVSTHALGVVSPSDIEDWNGASAAGGTVAGIMAAVIALLAFAILPARAEGGHQNLVFRVEHQIFGDVGTVRIDVRREGVETHVRTSVYVHATVLGLTLHRITGECREVWREGQLLGFASAITTNGNAHTVRATFDGANLVIDTAEGRVSAPPETQPENPWSLRFTRASTILSPESGELSAVQVVDLGSEPMNPKHGGVAAHHYLVRGETERHLYFDGAGLPVKLVYAHSTGKVTLVRIDAKAVNTAAVAIPSFAQGATK